jgi:hypothetical protein
MLLRRFAVERLNILPPRVLIATGLILIAGSLIWPRVTVLHGTMSSGGIDFIQGFLVGLAIAFEIMGLGGMVGGRGKDDDSSPDPRY